MRPRGVVFAFVVSVVACGGGDDDVVPVDAGFADAGAADSGTSVDASVPDAGGSIDGPAGQALEWLIAEVNGDGLSDAEMTERFGALFLANNPQLAPELEMRRGAMAPLRLDGVDGSSRAVVGILADRFDTMFRISLSVNASDEITRLTFAIATALDERETWDDFTDGFARSSENVNFMVAEVTNGMCEPIASIEPDLALNGASTFKLWVLAALAQQIEASNRAWNDPLTVLDAHKCLPSGQMQNEPEGTMFELEYFAQEMIRISDNTATDHLIYELGRENVESIFAPTGHADPTLNMPLLAVRELFNFYFQTTTSSITAYLAMTEAEQRLYIENEIRPLNAFDLPPGLVYDQPIFIDDLGWYESPNDICDVFVHLRSKWSVPGLEPIQRILSVNPGLVLPPRFTYVGFKGGGLVGALSLSWLLGRDDGRWFVLTLNYNDSSTAVLSDHPVYEATVAARLLADAP